MEPGRAAIVLNGPGRVGREFLKLLAVKARYIEERTSFAPVLVGVKSRRGILFSPDGLAPDTVFAWLHQLSCPGDSTLSMCDKSVEASRAVSAVRACVLESSCYAEILDNAARSGPAVVVEATPTDLESGEPGLHHVTEAIKRGASVVCLAKGPLVVAFGQLRRLAVERGVSLRYSGAVAAALPTVDTAVYAMAGADIYEIDGVLNGTSNFILNRMAEGESYADALRKAQTMGVAEANPVLDVEGLDSAAKLLIIANTVWDLDLKLEAVRVKGITDLDPRYVGSMAAQGTPVRLITRATRGSDGSVDLSVQPACVQRGGPFSHLPGTSKAVRFRSAQMGEIVVSGGASDVVGAAASALKDVIHVLEEQGRQRC